MLKKFFKPKINKERSVAKRGNKSGQRSEVKSKCRSPVEKEEAEKKDE